MSLTFLFFFYYIRDIHSGIVSSLKFYFLKLLFSRIFLILNRLSSFTHASLEVICEVFVWFRCFVRLAIQGAVDRAFASFAASTFVLSCGRGHQACKNRVNMLNCFIYLLLMHLLSVDILSLRLELLWFATRRLGPHVISQLSIDLCPSTLR